MAASAKAEDRHQGVVDAPDLLTGEVSYKVAEPSRIDGAHLLDKDASRSPVHFDLGPKRCRPSAARRRCDQDDGSRKQFVGLDDDSEAVAVLFVANALGKLEPVDVTPKHAATP